ncbi:glycosyltransferase family 2 protein [Aeoliella mucimassa]|uniref:N-acetylglucosaminyl-diphospho-decaprenol L-rhamnosyltransferase n=1 Tax=Aeoliella mucimassa TaxID=2527972 RepID=A0A518AK11_9BACT|nr:glycosyltransferase family 2 protein [Aeoliella mucimassa]QDU55055.1 N-acetylglucosaminyl-diphospho-decaprenol L-rhamnosyltransferase [Aeoliella mucimassa]
MQSPSPTQSPVAGSPLRTAAVIVNYGTGDLTCQCLESLVPVRNECASFHVYVVDNCSPDDSADKIERAIAETSDWASWIELIRAPKNGGFAYGNNVGIKRALELCDPQVDAIWLLNSDTIVHPGALIELLAELDDERTGIVGSRLENPDGSLQTSSFRFHTPSREWARGLNLGWWNRISPNSDIAPAQIDEIHHCDWLAGASMLIRRELIEDVGLLDDRYFLYYEEVDFCYRAAKHHWKTIYKPASRVIHLVGQSSGVTNTDAKLRRVPKYWFESRARYFEQNFGKLQRVMADSAWLLGHLVFRLRTLAQLRKYSYPDSQLSDFTRYNFWPPTRV